jgi:hypothetical protein
MATQQLSTITSVYVGYPVYAYVPTPASLGINSAGSAHALYSLANQGPFSVGITAAPFEPVMARALSGSFSIGISDASQITVKRAIRTPASLGITSASKPGKLRSLQAVASLGITSIGSPTHFFRMLSAFGSLGITSISKLNVKRVGSMTGSLGISGSARPTVTPKTVTGFGIAIFEATDLEDPTTLGSVLARNYQRLTLDQTLSSYPEPFTLLN